MWSASASINPLHPAGAHQRILTRTSPSLGGATSTSSITSSLPARAGMYASAGFRYRTRRRTNLPASQATAALQVMVCKGERQYKPNFSESQRKYRRTFP